MMKQQLKNNFFIFIICYISITIILMTLFTFYDLEISQVLTKKSLNEGYYYTTSQFALFIELFGYILFYLFTSAACVLLAAYFLKGNSERFIFFKVGEKLHKILNILAFTFCMVLGIVLMGKGIEEIFKNLNKYFLENTYEVSRAFGFNLANYLRSSAIKVLSYTIGILIDILFLFIFIQFKEENLRSLSKAFIVMAVMVIFYLLFVSLTKGIFNRPRYRTMNLLRDFSYYTPWYKLNIKRSINDSFEVVEKSLSSKESLYGVTDYFKSFPSGHTYSAALGFVFFVVPDLVNLKKLPKVLCYVLPSIIVLMVAVGRVIAGAHFASDVFMGAFLALSVVMLAREFIILKGAHFKALKKE